MEILKKTKNSQIETQEVKLSTNNFFYFQIRTISRGDVLNQD